MFRVNLFLKKKCNIVQFRLHCIMNVIVVRRDIPYNNACQWTFRLTLRQLLIGPSFRQISFSNHGYLVCSILYLGNKYWFMLTNITPKCCWRKSWSQHLWLRGGRIHFPHQWSSHVSSKATFISQFHFIILEYGPYIDFKLAYFSMEFRYMCFQYKVVRK